MSEKINSEQPEDQQPVDADASAARGDGLDSGAEESTDENAAGVEDLPGEDIRPTNEKGVPLPPHFEPIPEEKLKRARRTRRILIVIIILLVLILLGAGVTVGYYYLFYGQSSVHLDQPAIELESEEEVQDRGTTETVDMPNLAQAFGKTPEEVVAVLGSEYTITKTEVSSPDDEENEEGTSEENTADAIAAVVTISYTPEEKTNAVGTTQVQNIYLSLDAAGVTTQVYFVSSMSLLDIPLSSFADLVATSDSFTQTLASAGVTAAPDISYTAPSEEDYTEYVDAEATAKKIKKQTTTMRGALVSEQAPTLFEITYTYDYGASGMEVAPDMQPSQRMLYIKLS